MNWKVTRINTWWSAEEAYTMLSFLDELREQLWLSHGDQITAYRQAELDAQKGNEAQGKLDLEGSLDF